MFGDCECQKGLKLKDCIRTKCLGVVYEKAVVRIQDLTLHYS